jgi:hypothetical protein
MAAGYRWYHAVTFPALFGHPNSRHSLPRSQERVAVFGKLAVNHADPVTAFVTGHHR